MIALLLALQAYEGGDGRPTADEIEAFKKNVNPNVMSQLNTEGALAWGESYILMSLIDAYKASEDRGILDLFVTHADAVLANRDDARGVTDEIRGRVMPGWGSTNYTDGKWHVWLVHTGMITYPMAAFARIVRDDSALHGAYKAKADHYLAKTVEAVDAFDAEWVETRREGYYTAAAGEEKGRAMAFNQMLALGRAHIELWLAGSGEKHLTRARRMARWFKSHLKKGRDDTYYWTYGSKSDRAEDLTHGAIDVDFACLAYRHEIEFTREDLKRFANTFMKLMRQPDDRFSLRVDGSGKATDEQTAAAGWWLDLADVHAGVYFICERTILEKKLDHYSQLGTAKLLKWKPKR